MGMHTARRSSSKMTSVAGRGLFTATAAFALIGGGAGMAFAGEAPADNAGHHHGDDHGDHHGDHGHGHGNRCVIDVVDPTLTDVETTADGAAGTGPVTDEVNHVAQPAHDFLCPTLDETVERTPLGDPSGDGDSLLAPVTGGVSDAPAGAPAAGDATAPATGAAGAAGAATGAAG